MNEASCLLIMKLVWRIIIQICNSIEHHISYWHIRSTCEYGQVRIEDFVEEEPKDGGGRRWIQPCF